MKYQAQHLITFTTPGDKPTPDNDIALKVLKKFHAENSLSITNCIIQIDLSEPERPSLLIKECNEAETEIERFPIEKISQPIYKVSNDQNDPLNNLLFFKINADKGTLSGRHEFHIFQLISNSAVDIAQEIKRQSMGSILRCSDEVESVKWRSNTTTPESEFIFINESLFEGSEAMILQKCFAEIESTYRKLFKQHQRSKVSLSINDITTASTIAKKRIAKLSKRQMKWPDYSLSNLNSSTQSIYSLSIEPEENSFIMLSKYVEKIRTALIIINRQKSNNCERSIRLCRLLFAYLQESIKFIKDGYNEEFIRKISYPKFSRETVRFIHSALYQSEYHTFWQSLGSNWNDL